MSLGEFQLIDRFFSALGRSRSDVVLGVGDDGAILRAPAGTELVMVTDTLVEGVHFPRGSSARSIGHRALAVNLSDLAAMGAEPAWALLALTLPSVEADWLEQFASGFATLALEHDVALVGGDTTSGPLCITVQLVGFVPQGLGLRRSGAQVGDDIYVSGTLGDAAAGLQGASSVLRERFEFPHPRVALGQKLRTRASAAMDVSDGLLADLSKLAAASGVVAEIEITDLPLSPELTRVCDPASAIAYALTGGDDYELLFTLSPAQRDDLTGLAGDTPVQRIGRVVAADRSESAAGARVRLLRNSLPVTPAELGLHRSGWDHFGS